MHNEHTVSVPLTVSIRNLNTFDRVLPPRRRWNVEIAGGFVSRYPASVDGTVQRVRLKILYEVNRFEVSDWKSVNGLTVH